MKILGIGSELLDGVVVEIVNRRNVGILIVTKTSQNKFVNWTQKEVEDYVSNNS